MRIVDDERADALYVTLRPGRPARTVFIDETNATLIDLDPDGHLLGIEVIFRDRDWSAQLTKILADHEVGAADVSELRMLAAKHRATG